LEYRLHPHLHATAQYSQANFREQFQTPSTNLYDHHPYITMFAKAAILSVLFAGSALAAPTSSPRPNELERRADWQEGKCEAHIYLNSKSQVFSRPKFRHN
jgi:hypothetical protein